MEINWYPGHMAKTKRQLEQQLGRVDLVIELCDARLPHSSRNPELDKLLNGKNRILLMNKADLADPTATQQWISCFRNDGMTVYPVRAMNARVKEVLQMIENASAEIIERAAAKGMKKTIRVMVVGVPNVGKSTFINRMHGEKIAKTGDRPGVTQSNQWVRISPYLELLDTPGMLWPRLDDQLAAKRLCYIGTVKDDVVDLYTLTISLLQDMLRVKPDETRERFHLKDISDDHPVEMNDEALLDAVCRGRGFLLRGGVSDYDRCCAVVLDEFRAGKLGRVTLELPG